MADAKYDEIAAWYDRQSRAGRLADDVILPALLALLGDVQEQHVCDLGCGQGSLARILAGNGAQVVGVDLSKEMLAIARQRESEQPSGIRYLHDDARTLASLDDAHFDAVVCHMALMDIADLAATYHSVWRVLCTAGRFIFSLTHPCFQAPHARWVEDEEGTTWRQVTNYFREGFWRSERLDSVRGRVGAHHRTLATYLNHLLDAGFIVKRVAEPGPAGKKDHAKRGYSAVAPFLVVLASKDPSISPTFSPPPGAKS